MGQEEARIAESLKIKFSPAECPLMSPVETELPANVPRKRIRTKAPNPTAAKASADRPGPPESNPTTDAVERAEVPPVDLSVDNHDADAAPPVNFKVPPLKPSQKERDRHELTHMPYQPWCSTCVASRGLDDQHRRRPAVPDDPRHAQTPKVHFDWGFLGRDRALPSCLS